ncbi:hypothetical protein HRG_006890 [Hirsutella rhossiliensis]|uniref:Uncharacterized protein n=1 Tax=Hirsutella rhossiliensis TaxID=111463 RepID=A0A9P8MV40_9HYPO|nr:uncharacterized protein HRG_06890 [Hirsutella rhossiliensis]KAH0961810.1 hypothetical protein HRG_06890 [Hirsutella rhossiliensis]
MSKTSAMAPTKRTILTEPQDWDRWVKELRARVDKLIHKLIFQDGSEAMELPERPTLTTLHKAFDSQWLRDIASVIRPLSDGYATIFYEDSRRIDEEAATAQYRVYQALRPDSIGSTPTLAAVPPSSTHWTFQLVARKIREIAEQQPHQQKGGIKRGAGFLADKETDENDPSEERPKKRKGRNLTQPKTQKTDKTDKTDALRVDG